MLALPTGRTGGETDDWPNRFSRKTEHNFRKRHAWKMSSRAGEVAGGVKARWHPKISFRLEYDILAKACPPQMRIRGHRTVADALAKLQLDAGLFTLGANSVQAYLNGTSVPLDAELDGIISSTDDVLRFRTFPLKGGGRGGRGRGSPAIDAAGDDGGNDWPFSDDEPVFSSPVGGADTPLAHVSGTETSDDDMERPAFIPVPPDGLCLSHVAVAARDPEAWMQSRDEFGWRRDRAAEQRDVAEAKDVLRRVIARIEGAGLHEAAARLRLAGPDGYPGDAELPFYASELGGRIEQVDLDAPQAPLVTFGEVGPLLYRVGHIMALGPDGHRSEHWVLVRSYMDKQPLWQSGTGDDEAQPDSENSVDDVDSGEDADNEEEVVDYEAALGLFRLGQDPLPRRDPVPLAESRRRLTGKQPPPAIYQTSVLKRPAAAPGDDGAIADDEKRIQPVRKRPAAAAADCEQPVMKKPAAAARPSQLCDGTGGCPCKFSLQSPESAARVQSATGQLLCMFCDGGSLAIKTKQFSGKAVTRSLNAMQKNNPTMVPAALGLIEEHCGPEAAKGFRDRLGRAIARPTAGASGREAKPHELCNGRAADRPCVFSLDTANAKARVQPQRGEKQCIFCNDDFLRRVNGNRNGLKITSALRKLAANNAGRLEEAFGIVGESLGAERAGIFRSRLARSQRVREPRQSLEDQWAEALRHRVSVAPMPDREHQKSFPKWQRDDERLREKKFGLVFAEETDAASWMTPLAQSFDRWARLASWVMCKE
jgi:hypothetical protein